MQFAGVSGALTHADDVAANFITVRQVPGNTNKNVKRASQADTGANNRCSPEVGVVKNLIENRKHLEESVSGLNKAIR